MFNIGAYLGLGESDHEPQSTDQTPFSVPFVAAGPRSNRPDHRAILMLRTLVPTHVIGIAQDSG
jgi:hypothetical protein